MNIRKTLFNDSIKYDKITEKVFCFYMKKANIPDSISSLLKIFYFKVIQISLQEYVLHILFHRKITWFEITSSCKK